MLSASKRTCVALTEVVIPCLLDSALIGFDDLLNFPKTSSVATVIIGDPHLRIQPEFRFAAVFFDVDMDRFAG